MGVVLRVVDVDVVVKGGDEDGGDEDGGHDDDDGGGDDVGDDNDVAVVHLNSPELVEIIWGLRWW